jgi:transportin-3
VPRLQGVYSTYSTPLTKPGHFARRRGPQVVVMQICLSLAAFAVQCSAWTDVVPSIIAAFSQGGGAGAVLQILQLLPEESGNCALRVTEARRDDFRHQLQTHFRDVMQYLCERASSSDSTSSQTQAIRCFGAWLTVVPDDVPMAEVAANPLVPLVRR